MSESTPILEMKKINKYFPGVKALSDVDFRLFPGEIHAIMGQNGAGKSTLVKVLTGVHKHDSGEMLLEGKPIRPDSPLAARKLGISTVYQEINLCPNLSVAENMFVGRQPMKLGRIDWKTLNRKAEEVLRTRFNVTIDVTKTLSSYSIAIQQIVAIARVLDVSSKVLILDEPTSSLDESEVDQLFRVLESLRAGGLAILFITHFLDQTYRISNRITILKNGKFCGEYRTEDLPKIDLIAKMLGKELSEFSLASTNTEEKKAYAKLIGAKSILTARNLGRSGSIAPFSLDLSEGEVLGLAGLLGSGRTEMARLLFGVDNAHQGEVYIKGKKTTVNSPRSAMMAGMGFCSEDRKSEGIFPELTVRENIILALQGKKGILRYIRTKKQTEIADELIKSLEIRTPSAENEIRQLSGGNQQKVMLARWLATNPNILILDEPTRGIDVGAKLEIMELILGLARRGMGLIFISSEFEEVVRCSTRIAVLKDRVKIAELTGEEVSENTIMQTIAGGKKV